MSDNKLLGFPVKEVDGVGKLDIVFGSSIIMPELSKGNEDRKQKIVKFVNRLFTMYEESELIVITDYSDQAETDLKLFKNEMKELKDEFEELTK